MARKALTLRRTTTEKVAESTTPIIQSRRKQVLANTQRKLNKPPQNMPIPFSQNAVQQQTEKNCPFNTSQTTFTLRRRYRHIV